MPKPIERLAVIDGETLQDMRFQPGKFTIDTFQIVRSGGQDISYASDYEEVRELKKLADELQLSILLVHPLHKQEIT